ncbi:glycosyltransferase family 4 protein [Candidatus Parcubacteria bacterium]|nr:glycosyltransferase family 4 protein [Patescibacteria group bacterium]MBU4482252.1 glycosyltransferase family 4 protein [Patescibacteria group bacterium]MCG2686820.1 glycosyltransferase family 4 protein [Candidatus Parcubacteria bacterium]
MKTLLVTTDFPPLLGGIANYYFNRVDKMNADDIIVLTHANKNANLSEYNANNFKIYRQNFFTKIIWPRWLPLIWHIYKIAKKEKINRIWVGQVLPVGTAVWIVCKILKLPYFITCHGNDLLRAKSHLRKYKLAKKILNSAEFVEANTEFTKNILIKDFDVPEEKIKIIYPICALKKEMVDKNKVEELKKKYGLENKKVLLTVGRLVESKGIDSVIKAMKIVWQDIPDLVYLIVGDGPEKENLKKISPPIFKGGLGGVNKNIIFTGAVPHSELPNYYALADAFILTPKKINVGTCLRPVQDTESFGIVYLEAREFGLPVIASKIGGTKEALKNYNNFTLVNPENINQIAEAIKKALFSESKFL